MPAFFLGRWKRLVHGKCLFSPIWWLSRVWAVLEVWEAHSPVSWGAERPVLEDRSVLEKRLVICPSSYPLALGVCAEKLSPWAERKLVAEQWLEWSSHWFSWPSFHPFNGCLLNAFCAWHHVLWANNLVGDTVFIKEYQKYIGVWAHNWEDVLGMSFRVWRHLELPLQSWMGWYLLSQGELTDWGVRWCLWHCDCTPHM